MEQQKPKVISVHVIIIILSLVYGFGFGKLHAQGKIDGTVIGNKSMAPIPYAVVWLKDIPSKTIEKRTTTDSTGYFLMQELKPGIYSLLISSMGITSILRDSIIANKDSFCHLSKLEIADNIHNLNEVTVNAAKLRGTVTIDKTIYNIDEKAVATAFSGLELLRQIPAVQVDFQNNVTLEGSSQIIILVDGKQRDNNFFAQLDPKSVEKIEVMSNPSVKYDANITGVINFVLKKDLTGGVKGSVSGAVPLTEAFSSNMANIEYGFAHFRIFFSDQASFQEFKPHTSLYRRFLNQNQLTEYTQSGSGSYQSHTTPLNYGFDWFMNDKNTFNFYANLTPDYGGKGNSNVTKEMKTNGDIKTDFTSNTRSGNSDWAQTYSIFYRRTFDKPSEEFTTDISYYIFTSKENNHYADISNATGNLTERTEDFFNSKKVAYAKLDYTLPLGSKCILYTGYNGYLQRIVNEKHNTGTASDSFAHYAEQRHAFYGNLSGSFHNIHWQAGIRQESTLIKLRDTTNVQYFCLLPQISVQQVINKDQSIKLNYNRSIQRPGINDLNPYINRTDSFTISYGNPNLKPAYSSKLEFSYSIQLPKTLMMPSIYYKYSGNTFQSITQINNGISSTSTYNLGKGYEYGVGLNNSTSLTKWMDFNSYFCLYKIDLEKIPSYGIASASKMAWRTNISVAVSMPQKTDISIFINYNSPFITPQNTNSSSPFFGINISKTFLRDDNGRIAFFAFNPFVKRFVIRDTETESENFHQYQQMYLNFQRYTVRFSYSFNNKKKIKKLDLHKELEQDAGGGMK
jgi:outer membrane receptor protein involved in Fe transport